ncbi:MAG: helix-turn-helix transcriptional regulator, partial [Treponema sp.]|nr:helix-turn-helix transcriptional regulator [Treponema sp.]
GENIKQIRKSKKFTQFELAEKAYVSEDTIKSLEQGRTWCSDKTLSQITDALEIDVVKLFMPVGDSFKKNKENSAKLKSAIASDVRNYINEILTEFE